MDDAALVGMRERVGERDADRQQLLVADRALAVEPRERGALDQLRDEVVRVDVVARVVERDDRRVLQARRGAALALDPQPLLRVVRADRDALDGDQLAGRVVAGDPDAAVAARADLFEQPVAPQDDRVLEGAPGARGRARPGGAEASSRPRVRQPSRASCTCSPR